VSDGVWATTLTSTQPGSTSRLVISRTAGAIAGTAATFSGTRLSQAVGALSRNSIRLVAPTSTMPNTAPVPSIVDLGRPERGPRTSIHPARPPRGWSALLRASIPVTLTE
jgi:hypothetical protein